MPSIIASTLAAHASPVPSAERHSYLGESSVGGQPTAASEGAGAFEFTAAAAAAGYETYAAAATADELAATLARMGSSEGSAASFVEVKLALGTREDLGRPTVSTHECKEALMTFLKQ